MAQRKINICFLEASEINQSELPGMLVGESPHFGSEDVCSFFLWEREPTHRTNNVTMDTGVVALRSSVCVS